ncbi:unnamed protein product [Ectocarpus sp. 13 AM-2016]
MGGVCVTTPIQSLFMSRTILSCSLRSQEEHAQPPLISQRRSLTTKNNGQNASGSGGEGKGTPGGREKHHGEPRQAAAAKRDRCMHHDTARLHKTSSNAPYNADRK